MSGGAGRCDLSISDLFSAAEKSLDDLISGLSLQINQHLGAKQFEQVADLTRAAMAVATFRQTLNVEQMKLGLTSSLTGKKEFKVRITPGALKYSYLSMTEGISKGFVKPGHDISVQPSNGDQFTTKVMDANRLQERGAVAKFFANEQIKAGDHVCMSEIQPGVWSLKRA